MDKTKVVTFRLDEETLTQLDDFKRSHYYWKRSFIICALLDVFFRYASYGTRCAIIRAAFSKRKNYVLKFEEINPDEK